MRKPGVLSGGRLPAVIAVLLGVGLALTVVLMRPDDAADTRASAGASPSATSGPVASPAATATATGAREPGGTTVDEPAVAAALCAVSPAEVRQLAAIPAGPGDRQDPEALRDALPLLEDKLAQLEIAAEGRPALAGVVRRVRSVRDDWAAALAALDQGRRGEVTARLRAADGEIGRLAADLDAADPRPTGTCPP
jgi:hypothetical protein